MTTQLVIRSFPPPTAVEEEEETRASIGPGLALTTQDGEPAQISDRAASTTWTTWTQLEKEEEEEEQRAEGRRRKEGHCAAGATHVRCARSIFPRRSVISHRDIASS